eukprot:COSAG05_NODE_1123_length_5793_cov_4.158588_9_plen_155_part_00
MGATSADSITAKRPLPQAERDPEMRMGFLVLLDTMVVNPGLFTTLRDGKLPGPQGQPNEGASYIGTPPPLSPDLSSMPLANPWGIQVEYAEHCTRRGRAEVHADAEPDLEAGAGGGKNPQGGGDRAAVDSVAWDPAAGGLACGEGTTPPLLLHT